MAIFGLVSTETYDSERFKNIRRSVQYQYPGGAFPLTGLLSIADSEETNDPQFSHWEKRWQLPRTTTASMGESKGPFKAANDSDGSDPQTITADSEYIICLASAEHMRVGKVFMTEVTTGGTAKTVLRGVVTAITSRTADEERVKFRALNTVADVDNGTTDENVGQYVLVIGTAFAQGRQNVTGEKFNKPVEFYNYTQIFRTPFMLTGTAMKAPLRYDVKGPHQDKSKEHAVEHMVDIEHAILFGTRTKYVASGDADPDTGVGLPLSTTGGIIYYLQRWEAGDYGTVDVSSDDSDDKRIIENSTGAVDEEKFDTWMEKLFRVTNNTSNEKLCVCGSGALKVLNQLWRSKVNLNTDIPSKETYGMKVVQVMTPWGDVYFKTHPLFSRSPELRNAMLFLDVKNMKLRPMKDRDTKVLANRQPNDADYRKDEWFTELGFEMWFPESHLYVKNVTSYTP
jgi:hypothetical protein